MKRWLILSLVGSLIHIVISAALFTSAYMFGMASFTSGSGKESRLLFRAMTAWNSAYVYIWEPTAARILPAIPPAIPIPKAGDTIGWGVYEEHVKETNRIAGIHTAARNIGFLFSATVGGCMLSGVYILFRKEYEKPA